MFAETSADTILKFTGSANSGNKDVERYGTPHTVNFNMVNAQADA